MANVAAVITSIRNIMRQDRGISGDAQRLEQLGWMLFLKIMDDKDQELEITKDDYVSVIPEKFQWRNWAADPEGITGDELLEFIDSNAESNRGLFATLRNLTNPTNPKRAAIVKEVFEGSNNYMKSGYEMRKVINKLNEIDFNNSEDKHIFGDIYESILIELRDAGNKGEYYTPRPITQLMTQLTDPKLGEKVLDPAAGTGGFLTAAIDHIRGNYVKTVEDEHVLQKSITGWELKPVSYVLGLTNLILHEMDVPDYHYIDSLKKEYNSIGAKDRVDVILANPPFGATIADGVETNFPATFRTKESADLFVVLMMQLLKANGRAAIVLPDGSITGDGIKARIREKLLTEFNLHTIIRLPQTTFFPATVSTNLLFFEKGTPTKEIWYYEHKLPEGQKSYSKTKPIQFSEFEPLIAWWNDRRESDVSWKVKVEDLKNWDLDIKNPHVYQSQQIDTTEYLQKFSAKEKKYEKLLEELLNDLGLMNNALINNIFTEHKYLYKNKEVLKLLKQSILQEAIQGKLTEEWRKENPDIEPASKLLERIKAEKEKLVKEKKIKKEKPLPPIDADEIPFELPDGWEWCRLGELGYAFRGKSPKYDKESQEVAINQKCVRWDFVDLQFAKTVKKEWIDSIDKIFFTTIDDILINSTGEGTIGRSAIVENKSSGYIYDSHVLLLRPLYCKSRYIVNFINSQLGQAQIDDSKGAKSTKQTELGVEKLRLLTIPLPPLDEQSIIVKRSLEFVKKLSLMEDEIQKSEQYAQTLMQAVLKEAFDG